MATTEDEPILYEITQVVNSLLGLAIIPKERDLKQIPRTDFGELKARGWPAFEAGEKYTNLQDLVEGIRHAVAHFRIQFEPCGGEIRRIIMFNRPPGQQ